RDLLVVGVVKVWAQVDRSSVFQRQGIARKRYPLVGGLVKVSAQVDAPGAPDLQREGKGVPADGEVRDLLVVGVVKVWAQVDRSPFFLRQALFSNSYPLVVGVVEVCAQVVALGPPVLRRAVFPFPTLFRARDLLVVGVVKVWAQVDRSSVFQRQGIASKRYPLVVAVVEVCAQVDALGAPVLQREGKGVPADGEVGDLLVVGVVTVWTQVDRSTF